MRANDRTRLMGAVALLLAMCTAATVAQLDVNIGNLANDPRFNKMLPKPTIAQQTATAANSSSTTATTTNATATATMPVAAADDAVVVVVEHPAKPSNATAAKPVTMPTTVNSVKLNDIEHSEIGKKEADTYDTYEDEYDYYEDDDSDDDDDVADEHDGHHHEVATAAKKTAAKQVIVKKEHLDGLKLKPIKNTIDDEKITVGKSKSKGSKEQQQPNLNDDIMDGIDDDDADDDDDDDDIDDEYTDDVVQVSTSSPRAHQKSHTKIMPAAASKTTHKGCPMNCMCEMNFNGYMVANCDRLDAETMHFDASITDLEVLNVPPKYPLLFGANFFKRIGLQHVNSIKIVDSTIENIHPDAFSGLDQLYAVNLTNTGLDMLPPDSFASNTKLRILSLSGNDLHAMQQKSSPFVDYMLNAPTVEELYLTRCNIKELLPTAFGKLTNVVFISLAENMLVTLPHNIFHRLVALEELDLSSNSIENLPRHIFDNTSLSILSMRYNEMSGRPAFIAGELQKIDLSYNKLVNINDMMFTDMPNLNNLMLKGNTIRKVHHAAFAPLKDLRHIDLSFNDLEQVSALLFLENGFLDTIRLNDNARLKKLPMEGFASQSNDFNVYLFDASNCDLSELGENTFATMPRLTMLNLSWNNIESVGGGLFSFLSKLVKLDLSNNLINDLSDMLLLHNRNLRKLNLAGNPLEKLSSKVFLPTKQLVELDLSDCNLRTIWTETENHPKNFLKNLKTLNVSNNEIAHIRITELIVLERLAVLDLSNNKLQCDKDFRDLMKWLEKKKITSGQLRAFLRETVDPAIMASMDSRSPWEEYSLTHCKSASKKVVPLNKNNRKINEATEMLTFDDVHDDDDGLEGEDMDDDDIVDSIHDKANENGAIDSVDIDKAYDDDDGPIEDDEEDAIVSSKPLAVEKDVKLIDEIVDHGVTATEVKVAIHRNKIVDSAEKSTNELHIDGEDEEGTDEYSDETDDNVDEDEDDDDDDDNTDDEDRFEVLRRSYLQYGYVMPMLLVVLSVFAILIATAKIMAMMMHRRGERYRQALLASKNSIVYQKLSEEINAPQTPKFHRYAPIEQV